MPPSPAQEEPHPDLIDELESQFLRQGHFPGEARRRAIKHLPVRVKVDAAFAAISRGQHEVAEELLADAVNEHFGWKQKR